MKKNINKITALLILFCIIFMCAACNGQKDEEQKTPDSELPTEPADISELAMENFVKKLEAGNYVIVPENYLVTTAASVDQVYIVDPDDPDSNFNFAFVSLNNETFFGQLDEKAFTNVSFYDPGKAIDAAGSILPNSWIALSNGNLFEFFYNNVEQPLEFTSNDENVKTTLLTLGGYADQALAYMEEVHMVMDNIYPSSVHFTAVMQDTGTLLHFDDLDLTLSFDQGKSDERIEAWVKQPVYPGTRTSWTEDDINMLDQVFHRDYGKTAVPFPDFSSYAMIFDTQAYSQESIIRIKDAHGTQEDLEGYIAKLKALGFKEETSVLDDGSSVTVYRLPLREEYRCYSELYPYYDNGFVMEGKLYYDNPSYEGIYAISEALVEHGFAPLKDTDVFEGWQAVDYAASRSEGWAYFFDYDLYMPLQLTYEDETAAKKYLENYGSSLVKNGFDPSYDPNSTSASFSNAGGYRLFRYTFTEDNTVILEFKNEKTMTAQQLNTLLEEHGLPSAEFSGEINCRDLGRYYYEISGFKGIYLSVSRTFASTAEAEKFLDEYTGKLVEEGYLNMDPSKIGSYKNFLYLNEELKKYVAFDYIPQSGGALVNLDFVSIEPDAEDHLQSMLP